MTSAEHELTPLDKLAADDGTILGVVDPAEGSPSVRRDPEIPRLIGMTEAAEILGVVRQRVWQLIDEDKLPAVKVGNVGIVLREQVVLEYRALMDRERQAK
ncbi:helix-turn-helix domain-containing protein [Actinophytocola sediminis]